MERKKCQVLPALTKVSFIIARHLDSENLYTQFLTPSESQIFKDAVTNFDKWSLFITATDRFNTAKENGDDELQGKESQSSKMSDEQVAAFRVRAMVFDQLVPQLYKCSKPCCKHSNAIDDIIQGFSTDKYDKIIEGSGDLDTSIHNQAPAIVLQPAMKTISQNTTEAADDETAPPGTILTLSLFEKGTEFLKKENRYFTADESTSDDALISPLELSNVPLMNVYHTFENDLAAMIEQRKLEVNSSKYFEKILIHI
jgi:hypothetical protein